MPRRTLLKRSSRSVTGPRDLDDDVTSEDFGETLEEVAEPEWFV